MLIERTGCEAGRRMRSAKAIRVSSSLSTKNVPLSFRFKLPAFSYFWSSDTRGFSLDLLQPNLLRSPDRGKSVRPKVSFIFMLLISLHPRGTPLTFRKNLEKLQFLRGGCRRLHAGKSGEGNIPSALDDRKYNKAGGCKTLWLEG